MSGTLKERSRKGGAGKIGGDGGKDDDSGGRFLNSEAKSKNFGGEKVKKGSFSLRKMNNKIRQLGCFGGGGGRDGECCVCLKRPMTLGSAGESPTSDPNSSEFGYDMLKGLIEKNQFYDKDCNTHLVSDLDVYKKVSSSSSSSSSWRCSHVKENSS